MSVSPSHSNLFVGKLTGVVDHEDDRSQGPNLEEKRLLRPLLFNPSSFGGAMWRITKFTFCSRSLLTKKTSVKLLVTYN